MDAAGRDVAIARFELDGRPAMAVALGWRASSGRTIDGPGAGKRAAALARAAGLTVQGAAVTRSVASGGWSVAWPRFVDGVPVPGDGLRLSLWAGRHVPWPDPIGPAARASAVTDPGRGRGARDR